MEGGRKLPHGINHLFLNLLFKFVRAYTMRLQILVFLLHNRSGTPHSPHIVLRNNSLFSVRITLDYNPGGGSNTNTTFYLVVRYGPLVPQIDPRYISPYQNRFSNRFLWKKTRVERLLPVSFLSALSRKLSLNFRWCMRTSLVEALIQYRINNLSYFYFKL